MYRQITVDERYTLSLLRQLGYRPAVMAQVLGRHRSTIGRELRRNSRADGRCKRGLGSIDLNDTWHPVRDGTRNRLQRPPLIGK